ncbi:hypothetical protein WJX73_004928 [Symbiochloris irregularis]|uniref:Uncharacterized protein n=1 Tax=Symbiochloris irregularis TaxID=706552 RepID=A0AAW1NXY3_9CHLO
MAARPWRDFQAELARQKLDTGGPEDLDAWSTEIDRVVPVVGNKQGTAVLLGWLGCSERHLCKYTEIWSKLGWDAVMLRAPLKDAANRSAMDALLDRWASGIQDLMLTSSEHWRVVFHVFSNTGWLCYGGLLQRLEARKSHVLSAMWPHRRFNEADVRFQMLKAFFGDCSQMYIYSDADVVIPVRAVENFMRDQLTRGRNVHSLRLEGSLHVQHLRVYHEDYCTAIAQFLQLEGIMGNSAAFSGRQQPLPQRPDAEILGTRHSKGPGMLHVHGLPMSPAPPPRPKKKKRLLPSKKLREGTESTSYQDNSNAPSDESVTNSSTVLDTSTDGWMSDDIEDGAYGQVQWTQEQDADLWACLEELRVKGS